MVENEKDREVEGAPQGESEEVSSGSAAETAQADDQFVSDLEAQLEEAVREKDQFRALVQRTQADLVNYRKRMQAEQEATRKNAVRPLIVRIIEGLDTFDTALDPELARQVDERWLDGVRAIRRTFEAILTGAGVERFEAEGQPFNPRLHEALLRTETTSVPAETVIKVLRAGYKLDEDVLRPALVQVAVAPKGDEASQPVE